MISHDQQTIMISYKVYKARSGLLGLSVSRFASCFPVLTSNKIAQNPSLSNALRRIIFGNNNSHHVNDKIGHLQRLLVDTYSSFGLYNRFSACHGLKVNQLIICKNIVDVT